MSNNSLLVDNQHGFRKGRSCITNLLEVANDFTNYFDKGIPFDCIYLDFQKAFDSVPHLRLIEKLKGYGVNAVIVKWISNFLSNRTQVVKVADSLSSSCNVTSGVPQGSVLGPTLFNVFINDICADLSSTCKVFADDTKIYAPCSEYSQLQNDLYKLFRWSKKWSMKFNIKKCKCLHFGSKNIQIEYKLDPNDPMSIIASSEEEKDLGVVFDESFKFDRHIQQKISKANQVSNVIRRSFLAADATTLNLLYKALVRPHLEYGNVIWHPLFKRQSIALENVQRRFTKSISSLKDLSYEDRLTLLNLPSLKYRRLRGDLIQCFKIVKEIDLLDTTHVLQRNYNFTRGHDFKLKVEKSSRCIRSNSFFVRVINIWNNLPQHVIEASNINKFKELLDRFHKDLMYNFD